jgi:AhpD family alkylhydroperoxidase
MQWKDPEWKVRLFDEVVTLSSLELVKMRASQISGCAFCIDMHSKDARVNGETEQRLYALSAWRETLLTKALGMISA